MNSRLRRQSLAKARDVISICKTKNKASFDSKRQHTYRNINQPSLRLRRTAVGQSIASESHSTTWIDGIASLQYPTYEDAV